MWGFLLIGVSVLEYADLRKAAEIFRLDLEVYRQGALQFLRGGSLYDSLYVVRSDLAPMPFTYPPLAAALMTPLSWVADEHHLYVMWGVMNVLLVGAVVAIGMGALRRPRRGLVAEILLGWGLALQLSPVRALLNLGQVGAILMLLVLVDFRVDFKCWPRGILIGLASAIKLTPLAFVLLFILRRDWMSVVRCVGMFAILVGIGFVLSPSDSWKYWTGLGGLSRSVAVFDLVPNLSLAGVVQKVGLSATASIVVWFLLVAATLVACSIAVMRQNRGAVMEQLAPMALLQLLVSPVSWDHHWVWVVPILVVCWGNRKTPVAQLILWTGLGVFLLGTPASMVKGLWALPVFWGITTLGMLAIAPLGASAPREDERRRRVLAD